MASISQVKKADIKHYLEEVMRKYPKISIRYSLAITNGTSLTITIYESNVDLMKPFRNNENPQFGFGENAHDIFCYTGETGKEIIQKTYEGEVKDFMLEICATINDGNSTTYSKDTDTYHDGWYTSIYLGNKNRDFIYNTKFGKKKKS